MFYTLDNTPIIRSIYEAFSSIKSADTSVLQKAIEKFDDENEDDSDDGSDIDDNSYAPRALGDIEIAIDEVKKSLKTFMAFIKTFDKSEFGTIYCEREWRSTKAYKFNLNDIAMVVLPKTVGGNNYFGEFAEVVAPKLKLPRSIPVVPWDDLIEH